MRNAQAYVQSLDHIMALLIHEGRKAKHLVTVSISVLGLYTIFRNNIFPHYFAPELMQFTIVVFEEKVMDWAAGYLTS